MLPITKDKRINVPVSEAQHDMLARKAYRLGITMAELLRRGAEAFDESPKRRYGAGK
jgi:hypothetical protein